MRFEQVTDELADTMFQPKMKNADLFAMLSQAMEVSVST